MPDPTKNGFGRKHRFGPHAIPGGVLTREGTKQTLSIGSELRQRCVFAKRKAGAQNGKSKPTLTLPLPHSRYVPTLLPPSWSEANESGALYLRSTKVHRTVESLTNAVAGLFPSDFVEASPALTPCLSLDGNTVTSASASAPAAKIAVYTHDNNDEYLHPTFHGCPALLDIKKSNDRLWERALNPNLGGFVERLRGGGADAVDETRLGGTSYTFDTLTAAVVAALGVSYPTTLSAAFQSLVVQALTDLRSSDDGDSTLSFPSSLTWAERKFVHEAAESRGLQSKSFGDADERFVVVAQSAAALQLSPPAPVSAAFAAALTAASASAGKGWINWMEIRDLLAALKMDGAPLPAGVTDEMWLAIDAAATRRFVSDFTGMTPRDTETGLRLATGKLLQELALRVDQAAFAHALQVATNQGALLPEWASPDAVRALLDALATQQYFPASSAGLASVPQEAADAAGKALPKMCFYSAHDSTIIPLLLSLGAWDGVWPPFASSLAFELWADEGEGAGALSGAGETSPINFLSSTPAGVGVDGNGSGISSPTSHDVVESALAVVALDAMRGAAVVETGAHAAGVDANESTHASSIGAGEAAALEGLLTEYVSVVGSLAEALAGASDGAAPPADTAAAKESTRVIGDLTLRRDELLVAIGHLFSGESAVDSAADVEGDVSALRADLKGEAPLALIAPDESGSGASTSSEVATSGAAFDIAAKVDAALAVAEAASATACLAHDAATAAAANALAAAGRAASAEESAAAARSSTTGYLKDSAGAKIPRFPPHFARSPKTQPLTPPPSPPARSPHGSSRRCTICCFTCGPRCRRSCGYSPRRSI